MLGIYSTLDDRHGSSIQKPGRSPRTERTPYELLKNAQNCLARYGTDPRRISVGRNWPISMKNAISTKTDLQVLGSSLTKMNVVLR